MTLFWLKEIWNIPSATRSPHSKVVLIHAQKMLVDSKNASKVTQEGSVKKDVTVDIYPGGQFGRWRLPSFFKWTQLCKRHLVLSKDNRVLTSRRHLPDGKCLHESGAVGTFWMFSSVPLWPTTVGNFPLLWHASCCWRSWNKFHGRRKNRKLYPH